MTMLLLYKLEKERDIRAQQEKVHGLVSTGMKNKIWDRELSVRPWV